MKIRNSDILAVLTLIALVSIFCAPFLKNISYITMQDEWLSVFSFNCFSRQAVINYHQLPLWSPYSGGGYPIIGHHYQGFINPFFIFVLFFGEVIGTKIIALLLYIVGACGMYYLCRSFLNFHFFAAFFSSSLFILSSYFPSFLGDGNYFHIYISLLPWALGFYLKSISADRGKKYIALSSITLGIILLQAGFFFVVAIIIIFLAVLPEITNITVKKRSPTFLSKYFKNLLIMLFLTLSICAVKIVPMARLIESRLAPVHSVAENDYEKISQISIEMHNPLDWKRLYSTLLIKHSKDTMPSLYVGFIPVLFALFGILFSFRNNLKWAFILIASLFLSMGPLAPVDLFKILWSLHPYFHFIFKHNKYFSVGIIFAIAILSGSIVSYILQKKYNKRITKLVFISLFSIVSLASLINLFFANIYFHKGIFTDKLPNLRRQDNFFQIYIKGVPGRDPVNKHQYFCLLQNVGLINWHSNIILKESSMPRYFTSLSNYNNFDSMEINPIYKGEFYFLNAENKVKCRFFAPNRIVLETEIKKADSLLINQNYNPGWRVNIGQLYNRDGLLAVNLSEIGKYEVVLYYIPYDFWIGFIISLATFVCLMISVIRDETHK